MRTRAVRGAEADVQIYFEFAVERDDGFEVLPLRIASKSSRSLEFVFGPVPTLAPEQSDDQVGVGFEDLRRSQPAVSLSFPSGYNQVMEISSHPEPFP
jgi:hypothetical protein